MKNKFISMLSLFLVYATTLHAHINISSTLTDKNMQTFSIKFNATPKNGLYQEYLSFSTDHPDVTLSDWEADQEPEEMYDPTFNETKKIFRQPVIITINAQTEKEHIKHANLYINYYQQSKKKIEHTLAPISFTMNKKQEKAISNNKSETNQESQSETEGLTSYLSHVLKTTNSLWVRLLLALLLGILLSLTPCIYPMIPITVGILQAQGGSSMLRNFFLSLSYTCGIATTFSLLGVLAAFTGQMFGSIMQNPFVILFIVTILCYLAGSMIGLYEMYTPSFLQSNTKAKGGSCISAFAFGAASGTVASPCLSPGLMLLLTLVTTLGSKIMGFALLFAFGVGLSIPLLVIGTFSSSLHVLPSAGLWMVEVKKAFGFGMLAMCIYFLNFILPFFVLVWLVGTLVITTGVYYLYNARSLSWLHAKNLVGITLCASSLLVFAHACKYTYIHVMESPTVHATSLWKKNYTQALAQAQQENKKLLLDMSAPFCTICKKIDQKIFCNADVQECLDAVVPVKMDGTQQEEAYYDLQKQFSILGVPTVVLIDPENEKEIQRWGAELYDKTPQDFIQEVQQHLT